MPRSCGVAIGLCVTLAVISEAWAASQPGWAKDFNEAENLAKERKCPILIFWHEGSEKLQETRTGLLSAATVRTGAAGYVCVEIDGTKDHAILEKLAIPANMKQDIKRETAAQQGFVFTDEMGRIYGRLPGQPTEKVLTRMMQGVMKAYILRRAKGGHP